MSEETKPAPDASESVYALPKNTTPTWEVELLLSGALVFSMLQVPGLLDDWMASWRPRLDGSLLSTMTMLYFYLKVTAYALISTFVLHLAMRAIWVAALGLRSVFPEGIDWSKFDQRPQYRAYSEPITPSLEALIDRADNRASLVFVFGLVLVLMSMAIGLFTFALALVGTLIEYFLLSPQDVPWPTWIILGLILIPMMLVNSIDRWFGAKVPPGHWLARLLRRIYALSSALVWGRLSNPFLLTIFSRIGLTRGNLLLVGALYSLMGVIVLEILVQSGTIQLPGERYLPEHGGSREFNSSYYDTLRSQEEWRIGRPYIQSERIQDDYVRLFIPYLPRRIEWALQQRCPAALRRPDRAQRKAEAALPVAEQLAAQDARAGALLDCVGSELYPLTLNGAPLPVRYDLSRDPRSELRGFMAMIDVRTLPPGRHVLAIARPPAEADAAPELPWVIPFWR